MSARATAADVLRGDARWCVVEGDASPAVASLPGGAFDALVTDPPSGIAFMGAEWDRNKGGRAQWVAWLAGILADCRRATRDGGRSLVWSLPRTSHWTGAAVEDAGWSIETTIAHLFGTGWPKGASQLKPAQETWWLSRNGRSEPLQVDGCRVGTSKSVPASNAGAHLHEYFGGNPRSGTAESAAGTDPNVGRYPPNLLLSHVQIVWYALRDDLPEATYEAIHAYYGSLERLRALRHVVPRDAVATGESEVLQPGVRWRVPQGKGDIAKAADPVRALRDRLHSVSVAGEERASEVLLCEVPQCSEQRAPLGRAAGDSAHGRVTREDGRGGERQEPSRAVIAVEGREVRGPCGLRACDGRCATADLAGDGARIDAAEVHPRASADRLGSDQSGGASVGGGASRQRCEDGQPPRESLCDRPEGALQGASGDGARASRTANGTAAAARGEPRLEVASFAVVPAWADYFVVAAVDGCVCEGTRRVVATSIHGESTATRGESVHAAGGGALNAGRVQPVRGHADPDGTEAVEAWRCVEECPVLELDRQGGELTSNAVGRATPRGLGYGGGKGSTLQPRPKDTGTASRFYPQFPADDPDAPWSEALFRYVAKPSRAERNVGCAGLPEALSDATGFDGATVAHRIGEDGRITPKAVRGPQANHHPTVKPVALMRWLIRLVTKPGDVVLDPFGGSGTTGVAALLEGRRVVLVEREPAFVAIIRARCAAADGSDWTRPVVARPAALAARGVDSGRQLSLLDAMAGAR